MSNQSTLLLVNLRTRSAGGRFGNPRGIFFRLALPAVVKSQLARGLPMAVHSPGSALAPQSLTRKQELRDFTNSLQKLDPPIPLHSCQVLEKVGKKPNQALTYVLVYLLAIYFPGRSTYGHATGCAASPGGVGGEDSPSLDFLSLSLQSAPLCHSLTLWTSEGPDPAKGGESC